MAEIAKQGNGMATAPPDPQEAALLDQAAQLFLEEGDGFTMDRLAEATGLSRATLYRRFGSRSSLVQRLIRERGLSADDLVAPDVRTRVLQAARTVFAQHGFSAATIEQIAQAAEVGPATIYRHFGSKEGLVAAFVQASRPRRVLRELAAGGTGQLEEDLLDFATAALHFLHDNQDLLRLALQESSGGSALREQLSSTQGRTAAALAGYLEGQIDQGKLTPGDPWDLALAFLGILFGHAVVGPTFYARRPADPETTARFAVHLFLAGCAAPKEPTR